MKITQDIIEIIDQLKNGDIVAIPTDTVIGFACNIYNEQSVKKIYKLKNRPQSQPLSIAVKNVSEIKKYASNITPVGEKIIKTYFPGRVTIILKKSELVPNFVVSNTSYVGIRVPGDENILKILKNLDFPIVLTSANIHGQKNFNNYTDLCNAFTDEIYYFDNKKNIVSVESTIVKCIDDKLEIIRKGAEEIIL